jgi:hypothetical protein
MRIAFLVTAAVATHSPPAMAAPPAAPVVLRSSLICPGLPLLESKQLIYSIGLDATVTAKGEGKGTLTLNVTPPNYDEYGDFVTGRETDNVDRPGPASLPALTLECKIELVKKGWVGRVNEGAVERSVYSLEGPKIRSTLYFATTGPGLTSGRLLVQRKNQRPEYVVEMGELKPVKDPGQPVPCHPGCFPAGTAILVPGGTKLIENVRVGDVVTSIGKDGQAARAAVEKLFTTTNKLVEVRTDHGAAATTDAQPFCLTDGEFRKAGELKAGDKVWQWRDGRRAEAVVRSVAPTGRQEQVFNLILGDSRMFVAGGFLVRGKPPADAGAPVHLGHGK